jgi:energy-coupling factor transporter ATP-binding protein EcfA2
MPFITLKTMGLSISFSSYFVMIKGLFMSYFFKTTINNFTIDKIAYMVITVIMGCFQMYQTFISTYHYYNNLKKINSQIYSLKQYLEITITNIEYLIQINPTGLYYKQFFIETECQCSQLKQLYMDIKDITPFSNSIYKLTDCGILLQKYYKLYENKEYEDALRYSFGFNGYLDNLLGIYDNLENGYINFNNFIEDNKLITDASGEQINSVCKFKEMYYPVLKENNPVKNDINMDKNLTISGPNASGKTSIIKTIAINVIFTQQIGAGFYNSCDLTPYTNIHCYLNINDFSGRDSLFQQEARKCLNIIKSIEECDKSSRHLLIIDELYSGTNPIDSEKASYAFLLYLANKNNLRFCLTTHLSKVCKKLNKNKKIKNIKMDVIKTENYDFKYTYKIKNGISQIYGGYKVLSDMGYPIEILDNMKNITKNDKIKQDIYGILY